MLNVAMTVLAIKLVDRVGRKPMPLGSLVGMVLSLTVLLAGFGPGPVFLGYAAALTRDAPRVPSS